MKTGFGLIFFTVITEALQFVKTCRFNSDVELGKFVGSTDLIPDAYRAITETSSTCQLHTTRSGIKVLAFSSFPDYTFRFHNREFDLVSSEHHEMFDFISTKVNPKFSINGAGVELFEQHFAKLLELLNQVPYFLL